MKRYTAHEMREAADNVCSDFTFARVNVGSDARPVYMEIKPHEVAAMLRQAADMMESNKKRKRKYEYSEKTKYGEIDIQHQESLKEARSLKFFKDSTIVRREVGKWEEV